MAGGRRSSEVDCQTGPARPNLPSKSGKRTDHAQVRNRNTITSGQGASKIEIRTEKQGEKKRREKKGRRFSWLAGCAPRLTGKRSNEKGAGAGGEDRGQRGRGPRVGDLCFPRKRAGYKTSARSRSEPMRPPSLLSLTLDSALLRIAHLSDLSPLPDHLLVDLFHRTFSAGKLTEKVLKLFLATDCEEIILRVQSLNIKQPHIPVLPTRCSEKF